MLRRYIGDRAFYRRLFTLMIPMMVQDGITTFVGMLDNIMIGRLGTLQMSGVSVVNQLIFVFNLCVFGAMSGASIFGAQFFGKGDIRGVRHTFRFKFLFSTLITVFAIAVFLLFGDSLIGVYLKGEGSAADVSSTMQYAGQYLKVMLVGLVPYAWSQSLSSTLRESNRAPIPMYAGMVAVFVNMGLNYVLIFGKLGAPALGVMGAALATVIARFAELAVILIWTWHTRNENPFIIGAFRSLHIPCELIRGIMFKGMPLMVNETLWSAGIAILTQCFSTRGLGVVAAYTISQTYMSVFSVAYRSAGAAIGIILGQMLGDGNLDEAKVSSDKLIAFSAFISAILGAVFMICAIFIPLMYNIDAQARYYAMRIMQICSISLPMHAFTNAAYFTLRSGGKVAVTILFDCCFVWVVNLPVVFLLSRCTDIGILPLVAISEGINIIKCVLGAWLVGKGIWIRNIVAEEK